MSLFTGLEREYRDKRLSQYHENSNKLKYIQERKKIWPKHDVDIISLQYFQKIFQIKLLLWNLLLSSRISCDIIENIMNILTIQQFFWTHSLFSTSPSPLPMYVNMNYM